MKTSIRIILALVWAALLGMCVPKAMAVWPPAHEELPNLDRRPKTETVAAATGGWAAMPAMGLTTLNTGAPDVRLTVGDRSEVKWIRAERGFLTGPGGQGRTVSAATVVTFPANETHLPTKAFVREHAALFGFGPEALEQARIKRAFVTPHNGLQTVVWEQELDGIPVFEAIFISHTTKRGELVSVASQFVPTPVQAAKAGLRSLVTAQHPPNISAAKAVALAARNIGAELEDAGVSPASAVTAGVEQKQQFEAAPLAGPAEACLMWVPWTADELRLCWQVTLTSRARGELYRTLVDVENGEILIRHCLTEYISDASYRVFLSDSPSPFSPSCPTPCTTQPPVQSPVLVTLSAVDTNASPNGWIDDGINETRGNNVDAHTDLNADNIADLPRPQGTPFRTFDFTANLAQAPGTYTNAAVTDLFYWCNWMHDKLYALGFTEAAGNFQNNNFGRGGFGNDALQADAQDGSGTDNANMSTPSDGSPPRMQMFVFTGATPDRDGDFDHEIVLHEYTHGLSNRRVGGGVGLSALQSRGMGEGWSDWYGLTLLSESGDDVNGVYAAGGYATHQFSGLTQNYYYGIRRYPYCTDLTKNPLTFKDLDSAQASTHTGVPRSPIIGNTANEVHNQGEVWCVTLWEARANLIAKHGFAVGNQMILQLVTDGMNLSPANPNFLQARDGILQADLVNNGGANLPELWAAFAKRGMGYSATSPSSSTTTGVVEAYDIPDSLVVTPGAGLTSVGPVGGPFSPNTVNFSLVNIGTNALNWAASLAPSWLTVSPSSGVIAAGGSNQVNVTINAAANLLPLGVYTSTLRFTNVSSGVVHARGFTLRVGQPDYFTELFDAGDNDLDNQTLTFTPNSSASYYAVCREPATNFPTPVATGTNLNLGSHTYTILNLASNISIYGLNANTLYVASEGHVTLLSGDSSGTMTLANHFSRPRVSASMAHLHPNENGGRVLWQQLSNRVAITFDRVIEYATVNTNSFQIELFHDGRIRLTHLQCATTTGLVGLSAGNGVPGDFQESDLRGYGICALPMIVNGPTNAVEGAGVLSGQVSFLTPVTTNVIVTLSSSDNSEIILPATVTILAGITTTNFNVTIVDDAELDGGQLATITATAAGYVPASTVVAVADNETAVLGLSVPVSVTEGDGAASVTIQASAAPTANITVNLSSSDTTELQVPAAVILPAGQTSAVFSATIVNDTQIDGPQPVTLTAQVPNWTSGLANMTVNDNEPTNLVVLLPVSAREGNGILTGAGQVRIGGTLTTNLLVSLSSLDASELNVPALVTIFAGATNAVFNLTIMDDAEIDSSQTVTVIATAAGFATGSTNMVITDNESPQEPFNPAPAHQATNVIQTSDLAWQSGAVLGEVITNDVYFGTTPTPGPAELSGTTTNTTWDLPLLAPQTTYYWQVIARKAGVTPGPVWQFTTRGLDHFTWDTVGSPQYVSEPFAVKVTVKDAFETTVSNFTGSVGLSGQSGLSGLGQLVNFDDLPGNELPISPGYRGLTWSNFFYLDATINYPNSGYLAGRVSPPNVVYNAFENPVSIISTGQFNFVSAYLTAAWNDNLQVQVKGYAGVVLVYSNSYTLSATTPTLINFNYLGVTKVDFTSSGGTPHPGYGGGETSSAGYSGAGAHFVMDNVVLGGSAFPIPITPTNSGNFVNGAWTGDVTVLMPATNVVLRADDGSGHVGTSNPFTVALRNDIAVAAQETPDPVSLGGNVTYSITVTNIGPTSATGVWLTNVLSPRVALVSATASQGTVQISGNNLVCNLQTLGSDAAATVTIVATATNLGIITNLTTVVRAGLDTYPANNSAVLLTTVQVPSITINDVTLMEGNAGTSNAVFTVSISPAPAAPVSVSFTTLGNTATAPGDFIATNGVLNFAVGQIDRSFAVAVVGDAAYEFDETFSVSLSGAVNATLADSLGIGTILNSDAMPTISIGDVILVEGNNGITNAVFAVTLSAVSGMGTTVYYSTANGNATAGTDFAAGSGWLSIPAGSPGTNIVVSVNGDMQIEPDEVFYVDLNSPANAILLKREGFGFIMNDDGLPGNADHFVWSPIASPQSVNQPFNVVVTALDAFNNPAVNFNGPAVLSAATDFGATNFLGTDTLTVSFPIYTGGYAERTQVIYPANELGGAGRISAIALDVASVPGILLSNWTIRLKPTTLTSYSSYVWESTNWTVVYQTNANLTISGWAIFNLATPFDYDGTNSLMVDFSFYNNTAYGAGSCRATSRSSIRSLYYYTSSYGNPLTWSGSSPSPYTAAYTPNLQLIRAPGGVIPIQPGVAGTFTNGVWAGSLTALDVATNVFLRAADGAGHLGYSAGFAVGLYDDVGISVTDSPDPVAVGAPLTYLLRVTNSGPATASGLVVSNALAAGAALLGGSSSQGTIVTNGQILIGDLGSLAAGTQVTITITVTAPAAGVLTNLATVTRTGPDNYPANNAATNITTVVVPALSINDASGTEPAGGVTNLVFTVSLSVASPQAVAVNFATANGTALAGSDYVATNGTLNFAPGQTNQTLAVRVLDDALSEPNETFSVLLSGSVNAVLGKSSGSGIIVDNDGPPEFKITALLTNNSKVVDHDFLTGDDRGGIAISASQVFVTGDSATARFDAAGLTSGVSLGLIRDSLCTDLRTETVYLLGNGSTPLTTSGGTVTTLIELNPTTGVPSGVVLPLSQSFAMSYGSGIFSGYGRIVVHTAGAVYDIYVPTGTVTSRGAMTTPNWYGSESWAIWGVAEYFDGVLYLTYRENSSQRIVRARVPDGTVTAVATFSSLSDMSSFVVSPSRNRWYFHHEYSSQFGGSSETLGYADAQLSVTSSNPPVIVTQPASLAVGLGESASFAVVATGSAPLGYQWRKNGTNLVDGGRISGVRSNRLNLLPAQLDDAGIYSVRITNLFGVTVSSNAVLTVSNHPPVAVRDQVAFLLGTPQVAFNVLSNDFDADQDGLNVQSYTSPTRGTLLQISNGQFAYQPGADFTSGQDQFTYTISDGQGGSASAIVSLQVKTGYLDGGDWTTFGNGPSHTGYYPGLLGGAPLVAGWTRNFGVALNQVAVGGGNVFVTPVTYFAASNLTVLDVFTGMPVWAHSFGNVFSINPPTFCDGRVYVQCGKGTSDPPPLLTAFDAANGNELWSTTFGAQWERYYAPTVVSDGIWVNGGTYGGLYGFTTNGAQRFFQSALAQFDQWTPSYYQGTIYTWVSGSFRAHDPVTGNILWTLGLNWNWDGYSMNTVPAIDEGIAFVQQRPNLVAIDLAAQTNIWTATGGVTGSPAVFNGVVYAIIGDQVKAFAARTGASLGVYQATNDTGLAWQPIITDDALFVASTSSTYIFDRASHQLRQTIPYGGILSLAEGRLYIAGQDGWLRTFTVSNASPVIVVHPNSQTIVAGSNVTFSVMALGTPPLRYQWHKDGAAISDGTNASYAISPVFYTNAGSYSVAVSNAVGFANSSNALLTVLTPPIVTTQLFNYIGAAEAFVIPAGVTSIQVECWGAQGGNGGGMPGGLGGYARANVAVAPGETVTICVGQVGQATDAAHGGYSTNAFNGGGRGWTWSGFYGYAGSGGGASDVRLGGSGLSNRVVVAGGGGGASGNSPCGGGAGGGLIAPTVNCGYGNVTGGSQGAGGVGGQNGSFGQGGMAQAPTTDGWVGGGGGGYYGGGCGFSHGAGAGGSSYVGGHGLHVTSVTTNLAGVRAGHGQVLITWQTASPALRFLAPQLTNGLVRLRISTEDSSPIPPVRASNIWVYATTNLSLPLSNWTALAIAPVLTNGLLQVDGINPTNPPALFFRAIEGSWNVRPLRLHLPQASGNNLQVWAGVADGTPLTPIRAAKVRFYFTTNLALPFSAWSPLASSPVLSNGLLQVACPTWSNSVPLYFRAEESP